MKTLHDKLTLQIQRLLVDEQQKQRLLTELEELDDAKTEMLAALIQEHDQEALTILDQKRAEEKTVREKREYKTSEDQTSAFSPGQTKAALQVLREVFVDPQKLAKLLQLCSDEMLVELNEIFTKALSENPEQQASFQHFFQEMRLQKEAFENAGERQEQVQLQHSILQKKEQKKQLDQLIQKAEKILEKTTK